jgi:hypothetical protein
VFTSPILAHFFATYPDVDRYYPLWKNDLFANTPEVTTRYEIRIYSLDNQVYSEGKPLYELLPTKDWENFSASVVIDMMGKYFFEDKKKFDEMKIIFETNKLNEFKIVEYALIKANWKPLDRYLYGKNIAEVELDRFLYEKR